MYVICGGGMYVGPMPRNGDCPTCGKVVACSVCK
jgi:hypothetical protein